MPMENECFSISKLVTTARSELLEQDDDDLDALAGEYAVELKDGMEHEQAVDLVLSVALYGENLLQRADRDLDAIADWINDHAKTPRTRSNAIEPEGFFERRETYNTRLRRSLPKYLVGAAINRQFLPERFLKTGV